jgi:hypothetical protein
MKKPSILFFAAAYFLVSGFALEAPIPEAGDINMSVHYTTTVKSDGSGGLELEFTLSKEFVAQLRSQGAVSSGEICTPPSPKFQLVDQGQGGEIRCVGSAPFGDLEELADIMENDLQMSVNRMEIKDQRFYYDVSAFGGSGTVISPIKMELLWILVMPGTPVANNADTVSGRTLTWDLLKKSDSYHMTAECAIGGLLGMDTTTITIVSVVLLSCCCIILLIAAAAVFILMRRKKNPPMEAASSAA